MASQGSQEEVITPNSKLYKKENGSSALFRWEMPGLQNYLNQSRISPRTGR